MKKLTFGLPLAALALALGGAAYADHHMGPRHDADGDGIVTRAEAEAHAKQMFAHMDANGDGKLDPSDREARRSERREAMFAALDKDADGSISREEFMAFDHQGPGKMHHRPDGERGHPGMMMMQKADTDNDGSISEAEFVAGAGKHFDEMDTNNDGNLTQDERQAARDTMRDQWRGMMRGQGSN